MNQTSYFGKHGSNQNWLIVLCSVLIFAVAGFVYAAKQHVGQAPQPRVANAVKTLSPADYTDRIGHPDVVTNLTIANGTKITSGPTRIVVKLGQSVNVNFVATGDEALIKLEGYAIITEAGPGKDSGGGFHFVADKAGSFNFYALSEEDGDEDAHDPIQLGTIVVR